MKKSQRLACVRRSAVELTDKFTKRLNKIMEKQEPDKIYTEETCIIIKPLKARVFKEEYQKIEAYEPDGTKIIILREKIKE